MWLNSHDTVQYLIIFLKLTENVFKIVIWKNKLYIYQFRLSALRHKTHNIKVVCETSSLEIKTQCTFIHGLITKTKWCMYNVHICMYKHKIMYLRFTTFITLKSKCFMSKPYFETLNNEENAKNVIIIA